MLSVNAWAGTSGFHLVGSGFGINHQFSPIFLIRINDYSDIGLAKNSHFPRGGFFWQCCKKTSPQINPCSIFVLFHLKTISNCCQAMLRLRHRWVSTLPIMLVNRPGCFLAGNVDYVGEYFRPLGLDGGGGGGVVTLFGGPISNFPDPS